MKAQNRILLDWVTIIFLVVASLSIVIVKCDSNSWTGLFPLGLLPLVVVDLMEDMKALNSVNKTESTSEVKE